MQIPVTVKVDGKTSQVALADLVRSLPDRLAASPRNLQAIADQQRQFGKRSARDPAGPQAAP